VFDAGLMKVTLEDNSHHAVYLSDDDSSGGCGQTLAYILKRLLLSHSNSEGTVIQAAAVQIIVLLLRGPHGGGFAVSLLKTDIAGEPLVMFLIAACGNCFVFL